MRPKAAPPARRSRRRGGLTIRGVKGMMLIRRGGCQRMGLLHVMHVLDVSGDVGPPGLDALVGVSLGRNDFREALAETGGDALSDLRRQSIRRARLQSLVRGCDSGVDRP